jgi:membrane protease YdiL (CAAX protease family)
MSNSTESPRRFVVQALAFEGALAVVACALGWLLPIPPWQQIHWELAGLGWGIAACIPLLAGMFVLRGLRSGPLGRLNRVVDQFVAPLFAKCTLLDFALISIVGGLGEELLFRGLIQAALTNWLGVAAGIVIASLLFGLAHIITPTYAVLAALIGVYLGWVWIAADNLLAPIVAHALYDFAALVYLTRGARGGASPAVSSQAEPGN